MKHLTILCFLLTTHLYGNFDTLWYETQNIYHTIIQNLKATGTAKTDSNGCHPEWLKFRQAIKAHLLGPPNRNFLGDSAILGTMVRSGIGKAEQFELDYLNENISESTSKLIHQFVETDYHLVPQECIQFNCTSTSLCHLFYLAKILETQRAFRPAHINTIVEFGGGFGNLSRVIHTLFPQTTYLIFDVPEVIAIQYLFLKGSMPEHAIKVHTFAGEPIEKNAINLIPSAFCDDTEIQADLFISTFALSETSAEMQTRIHNKKYYNANICYITGQLFQEAAVTYVNHTLIQNSVQELFRQTTCSPFHAPADSNSTYELIGVNPS